MTHFFLLPEVKRSHFKILAADLGIFYNVPEDAFEQPIMARVSEGEVPDFVGANVNIVSEKFRHLVEEANPGHFRFRPVKLTNKAGQFVYYIMDCTDPLDLIDEEQSNIQWRKTSQKIRKIEALSLKPESARILVFSLKHSKNSILAAEDFVQRLEEEKVDGYRTIPVTEWKYPAISW